MTGNRRNIRILLTIGSLVGVGNAIGLAVSQPAQIGIATDVYHHAGQAMLNGQNPYVGTPPGHPGFHFLYPPIMVLWTLPYGLIGDSTTVFAVQSALNLIALSLLVVVILRTIEEHGIALQRADRVVIAAFTAGWFPIASTIVMGQVNIQLALGIAVGATLLERAVASEEWTRERGSGTPGVARSHRIAAGALFALVALVKLFPTFVGAWLLRLRAWTAVLAALATGVGGLVAGVLLFGPDLTTYYVTETLARELSVASFANGPAPESPYMTVRRQFAVLAPWLPDRWLLPAAIAVLTPVVLAAYRVVDTPVNRLLALHATLLATLIAFPLEPFYLGLTVFPMVPLVYLLDEGRAGTLYLIGVLIVSVPVWLGDLELYLQFAPAVIADPAIAVARAFYSFAMPMMIGVWALLAGIVNYQWSEKSK